MFTWAPPLALCSDTRRMLNWPRGPNSTPLVCVFFFFLFRDALPPPRLANGREDKLHLNDVIISDAASCNQGRGAGSGICREVLYAWVGRQAEPGCGAFICLLSPSVLREKKRKTRRRGRRWRRDTKGSKRWEWGTQTKKQQHTKKEKKMTMKELFFWPPEICVSAAWMRNLSELGNRSFSFSFFLYFF